jgi:hypothetical protein
LEKKRLKEEKMQEFENMVDTMKANGYEAREGIISVVKANVMAIVLAGPIVVLLFIVYSSVATQRQLEGEINLVGSGLFFLSLLISIPIHELLHGIGWSCFCENGWKSIRFGMMWKYLTPYCHCKEALNVPAYLFGGLFPLVVLGFGSYIVAIIGGNIGVLLFSLFNVLAAGGDITIALMLRKHRGAVIIDHPIDCGFVAFHK